MERKAQTLLYGRRQTMRPVVDLLERATSYLEAGSPYPAIQYLQSGHDAGADSLLIGLLSQTIAAWPEIDEKIFLDEDWTPSEEAGLRQKLNDKPFPLNLTEDFRDLIAPLDGLGAEQFRAELLRVLTTSQEITNPTLIVLEHLDLTTKLRLLWRMSLTWKIDNSDLLGPFGTLLINDLTWRLSGLVETRARNAASDLHLINIASPCVWVCEEKKLHLVENCKPVCADGRVKLLATAIRGQWRSGQEKCCKDCFHLNAPLERMSNKTPYLLPGSDDPLAYTLLDHSRYEDLQENVLTFLEMACSRFHARLNEGGEIVKAECRLLCEMCEDLYALSEQYAEDHSEIIARAFVGKWQDGNSVFRANFPNKTILGDDNYADLHNFMMYSKLTPSQEEVEGWFDGLFTGRSSQKVVDGFYERLRLWVINQASESDT